MKPKSNIQPAIEHEKYGGTKGRVIMFAFFLFHMLGFGTMGFLAVYFDPQPSISLIWALGILSIFPYVVAYLDIFGRDAVKWMFINAILGIFGIYSELRVVLRYFDKAIEDYAWYLHFIPFAYYVLYTFLLYQLVLFIFRVDLHPERKKNVETGYIVFSLLIYLGIYLQG